MAEDTGRCHPLAMAWSIDTGAAPATARPKVVARPPIWTVGSAGKRFGRTGRLTGGISKSASRVLDIRQFKEQQGKTLAMFREQLDQGDYAKLHRAHFDWWMFPIDDGSKPQWNVTAEEDVQCLKVDAEWLAHYQESMRLVTLAWGWDLTTNTRVENPPKGMHWTDWDVRLSKMCRSAFLFEETQLLASLQAFARDLQANEKGGKSFYYGSICLDEMLLFELPRRKVEETSGTDADLGAKTLGISVEGASETVKEAVNEAASASLS